MSREAGHTMSRQWEMIKLLPRGPQGLTTSEIADILSGLGYPTTRRTVERDLADLASRFPMLRAVPGTRPQQWIAARDADIGGLPLAAALSLFLVAKYLHPLLPPAVTRQLEPVLEAARTKLQGEGDRGLGAWSDKIAVIDAGAGTLPPAIDDGTLQAVQEALLGDCKLKASYLRSNGTEAVAQTMSPLGLVLQGQRLYLVAVNHARKNLEPRVYPLHRVRSAQRLYDAAQAPEGFSLRAYLQAGGMSFGSATPIELKAWISPMLALQLHDTPLEPNQRIRRGPRRCELRASVLDTWRLRWWLMQHTGELVVLSPDSLRHDVTATLERGYAMYRSNDLPRFDRAAPASNKPHTERL